MLTHIFQWALDFGTVPTQWKHAYVTPVFKKGSKSDFTYVSAWSVNAWSILL